MQLFLVSAGSATRSAGEDFFRPPTVGHYLVRVATPIRKDISKELRRVSQGNVRYVPHHTFLVDITDSALSAILDLEGVVEVFVYPSTMKIDLSLKAETQAQQSLRRTADAAVTESVLIGALLSPGRTDRDPAQMVAQWESALNNRDAGIRAVVETADSINVHTAKEHLGEVAEWLATQDHVERVIWNNGGQPQDYYNAQAIQGGRQGYSGAPAWNKGIQGQGEIITVSDTGIDEHHCVFYDPSESASKCSGTVGYQSGCINTNHRKIVSIQCPTCPSSVGSNFFDRRGGHGTQVASLAAGSASSGDMTFFLNGVAPGAKLLIFDCNHDTQTDGLALPSNWASWWQHSYQGGSRIHSASWIIGTNAKRYATWTWTADKFVYDNPDYVAVFAAGNFGDSGYFSVLEPSTAKNVLAVGMTRSAHETYEKQCEYSVSGCQMLNHYMWVDRAQWMALADEAANNHRQISDYQYWDAPLNNQFWSFYDFFRSDCTPNVGKKLCGRNDPAEFFTDTWYSDENRIEIELEKNWGGPLGDNEVFNSRLVAPTDHPCGCDLQPGEYTNGEVLILHWDWDRMEEYPARTFSMCDPTKFMYQRLNKDQGWFPNTGTANSPDLCTKESAWSAIKASGARGVVLIGQSQTNFEDLTPVTPSNADATGPAVFQVKNQYGQILFAAVAKEFFLKRMTWYQIDPAETLADLSDFYTADGEFDYYAYFDYYDYQAYGPGHYFSNDFKFEGVWGDDFLNVQMEPVDHAIWRSTGSRGPTHDLRFKPDIVCAGELPFSARSNDMDTSAGGSSEYCPADHLEANGFKATSGTSMSTPQCAGGVALIRQYFQEGWHAAGVQDASESVNPSAALVKAMVINSGQPVIVEGVSPTTGAVYRKTLEGYPNFFAGFGYMALGNVLMFDDSDFTLLFEDRANDAQDALNTGDAYETCFTVSAGDVPLVVSLAWTDAMGAVDADRLLVNNLDLVLVSPTGSFYYGNHLTHAQYGSVRDDLNNLERVTVDAPVEVGSWSVRVIGSDIPDGPQGFALVGTGNIAAGDLANCASLPQCENSCSGQGICVEGHCECNVGFAGTDCSIAILQLTDGVLSASITVQAMRTTYCWLDLSEYTSADVDVTVTVTSGKVDVEINDCGYPRMNEIKSSAYGVTSSVTRSMSSNCENGGKWVVAVTGNTDPRSLSRSSSLFAVQDGLAGSDFTVVATSSNTVGGVDPFSLESVPNTNYASCTLTSTWQDITALQVADSSKVKTGGLGGRIVLGQYEVWLCLLEHECSTSDGNSVDPICFVYDEMAETFKVWGKNSELEIY